MQTCDGVTTNAESANTEDVSSDMAMTCTRRKRTSLVDVNDNVTCALCRGYLIDAHTLTQCMHSYCRSCIVKHLRRNALCPKCGRKVIPRNGREIRADRSLQELVYALVPSLLEDEMRKRVQFYRGHLQSDYDMTEKKEISLCLRLYDRCPPFIDGYDVSTYMDQRYLLCPQDFPVKFLEKFIRHKFNLDATHRIDLFFENEKLYGEYTLRDVAVVYRWNENTPMMINYVVEDRVHTLMKRIEMSEKRKADAQHQQLTPAAQPVLQGESQSGQHQAGQAIDSGDVMRDASMESPPCNNDSIGGTHSGISQKQQQHRELTQASINVQRPNGIYRFGRPGTPKLKRKRGRPPKLKQKAAGIIAIQARRQARKQARGRLNPTPKPYGYGSAGVVTGSVVIPPEVWDCGASENTINAETNVYSSLAEPLNTPQVSNNEAITSSQGHLNSSQVQGHLNSSQGHTNFTLTGEQALAQSERQRQLVMAGLNIQSGPVLASDVTTAGRNTSALACVENCEATPSQHGVPPGGEATDTNLAVQESVNKVDANMNSGGGVNQQMFISVSNQPVAMGNSEQNAMYIQQPTNQHGVVFSPIDAQNASEGVTYAYTGPAHQVTQHQSAPGAMPLNTIQFEEEPITIPGLLPPKRRKRGRPPKARTFPTVYQTGAYQPAPGFNPVIKRKRGRPPKRKVGLPPVLVVPQRITGDYPPAQQNFSFLTPTNGQMHTSSIANQTLHPIQPLASVPNTSSVSVNVQNVTGSVDAIVCSEEKGQSDKNATLQPVGTIIDKLEDTGNSSHVGSLVSSSFLNSQTGVYPSSSVTVATVSSLATLPQQNSHVVPYQANARTAQLVRPALSTNQTPAQQRSHAMQVHPLSHSNHDNPVIRTASLRSSMTSQSVPNTVQRSGIISPFEQQFQKFIQTAHAQKAADKSLTLTQSAESKHVTKSAQPVPKISRISTAQQGPMEKQTPYCGTTLGASPCHSQTNNIHTSLSRSEPGMTANQQLVSCLQSNLISVTQPQIIDVSSHGTQLAVSTATHSAENKHAHDTSSGPEVTSEAMVSDPAFTPDSPMSGSSGSNSASPQEATKKRVVSGEESKEKKRFKLHNITEKLYSSLGEKTRLSIDETSQEGHVIPRVDNVTINDPHRVIDTASAATTARQLTEHNAMASSFKGVENGVQNNYSLIKGCAKSSHSVMRHSGHEVMTVSSHSQAVIAPSVGMQAHDANTSIAKTDSLDVNSVSMAAQQQRLSPSCTLASIASIQRLVNSNPLQGNHVLAANGRRQGHVLSCAARPSGNADYGRASTQIKTPKMNSNAMVRQRHNLVKQRKPIRLRGRPRVLSPHQTLVNPGQQTHAGTGPVYAIPQDNQAKQGPVYAIQQDNPAKQGPVYAIPQDNQAKQGPVYAIPQDNPAKQGPVYAIPQDPQAKQGPVYVSQQDPQTKQGPVYVSPQDPQAKQGPVYVGVNVYSCAYIKPQGGPRTIDLTDSTSVPQGTVHDHATHAYEHSGRKVDNAHQIAQIYEHSGMKQERMQHVYEQSYSTHEHVQQIYEHSGSNQEHIQPIYEHSVTRQEHSPQTYEHSSTKSDHVVQVYEHSGAKQVSAVKPNYRQPMPTHVPKSIQISDNDKPLDFSLKKMK